MLKREIKYVDFNGEEREETFYFHLNKVEVAELEASKSGGIEAFVKRVVSEKDKEKLIEFFKGFILLCYGEKSDDGRYFEKSEELSKKFSYSPAFEILFVELASDADAAAAFVNGVAPKFD